MIDDILHTIEETDEDDLSADTLEANQQGALSATIKSRVESLRAEGLYEPPSNSSAMHRRNTTRAEIKIPEDPSLDSLERIQQQLDSQDQEFLFMRKAM